jgi:hypothetical protein
VTSGLPQNDTTSEEDVATAALDEDAAPATGLEPDTAPDAAGETGGPAVAEVDTPSAGPRLTQVSGAAAESDEMRGATDDLRSSEGKSQEARQIADDLSRRTDPAVGDDTAR